VRSSKKNYPKKFLDEWMNQPKKNGGVQHLCNNTFSRAILAIPPEKRT
jgi:hypothetical protein